MDDKVAEESDSQIARDVRTGIKIAAYPTSFIAGYQAAATVIRNSIYKNLAQTGIFEPDKKTLKVEPLREAMTNKNHPSHNNIPDFMMRLNENYRIRVRDRFKEIGLNHIGDYWKGLNRNQMVEAVVMGMTVTGIVLGSLLTVANSRGLLEYLTDKEESKKAKEPIDHNRQ